MRSLLVLYILTLTLLADTTQKIEFGYYGSTGNSEESSVHGEYSIIYDETPWKLSGKLSAYTSKKDGKTNSERYEADANGYYYFKPELFFSLETSALRNTFEGYDQQYNLSPGIGITLFKSKKQQLDIIPSYLYRRNNYTTQPSEDLHYGRLKGDYTYNLSASNTLSATLYAIDNLKIAKDYEFDAKFTLTLAIIEKLSLQLSYEIKYDNLPPQGKKKTDTYTKIGVVYNF